MLEEAILDAAWAELVATGYGGFTMAGVAAKAGTSKAVLYRRWPGKEDLVAAVLERRAPRLGRPTRTGDLRADTLAILQSVAAGHRGLATAGLDPGLTAALRRRTADEAMAQLAEVVAAAGFDPAAIGPRILRLPIVVVQHALMDGSAFPDMAGTVDEVFLPLVHLRGGGHV